MGVDWLLTWLSQTQALIESGVESLGNASEVPAAQRQVQWLTLLPSVPAFQDLLAPAAVDPLLLDSVTEEPPPDEAPANTPILYLETTPLPSPVNTPLEKPIEVEATIVSGDEQPVVAVPAAPLLPIVSAPAEPMAASNSTLPAPLGPVEFLRRADPSAQPQTPQLDKGELIWAAEFVVAENSPEPPALPPGDAIPVERQDRKSVV